MNRVVQVATAPPSSLLLTTPATALHLYLSNHSARNAESDESVVFQSAAPMSDLIGPPSLNAHFRTSFGSPQLHFTTCRTPRRSSSKEYLPLKSF